MISAELIILIVVVALVAIMAKTCYPVFFGERTTCEIKVVDKYTQRFALCIVAEDNSGKRTSLEALNRGIYDRIDKGKTYHVKIRPHGVILEILPR